MDIHAHMEEAEGALFHFSLIRFSFWFVCAVSDIRITLLSCNLMHDHITDVVFFFGQYCG